MGFFQDLKQDLSHTVSELEGGGTLDVTPSNDDGLDIDVAAMLDNIDNLNDLGSLDNMGGNDLGSNDLDSMDGIGIGIGNMDNFDNISLDDIGWQESVEMPMEEPPAEETLMEETLMEEAPIEEAPIEEAPMEEDTIEEAPMEEEIPIEEYPIEELTVEDIPTQETLTEDIPLEDMPMEETPIEEDIPIVDELQAEEEAPIDEENIINQGDNEMEELLKEVELNVEAPELIEEPVADIEAQDTQSAISSDTAVITEGMTITGDIASSGNMDLIGTVTGNIDILGKLNITGTVTGNSSAAEIYAESAQINGEVRSKGSVKIGQSSVIIGDIFATSAVIAGAVKGDIDVHGPVILDTSAIVMGNIKSKSVQINNGAVIEGMCSQCYADVSPSTFFNDVKKNRNKGN